MKKIAARLHALLAVVLVFGFVAPALADDTKKWQDEAELSYVQTGGNTDIMTLAAKNTLKYQFSDQWSGTWIAGALYADADNIKSAERYYTDLRADFQYTDRLYFYGLGGWSQDKFAGIDHRYYIGPGAGYHFLTGERHFLSAEAGLSYAAETYTDDTDDTYLEGRAYGEYAFVLTEKTKFTQSLEYLHNFNDTDKYHVISVTGLTTSITDIISVKMAYEVHYANRPVPDTLDDIDTIFTVALVVNF